MGGIKWRPVIAIRLDNANQRNVHGKSLSAHAHFRRVIRVWESEDNLLAVTHVSHQRGTEAGDTCATFVANAGVDDSGRSSSEQFGGQVLRGSIAIGIEAIGQQGILAAIILLALGILAKIILAEVAVPQTAAQVVKVSMEVG